MSNPIESEIRKPRIIQSLSPFGVSPSDEQVEKIAVYIRLLLKWNRVTSLTTVTNPVEIVSRHFGESMFAATLLPVENGRLVDIGSGAGFPGLPLKILRPRLQVTLVESNKKKCAFLAELARTLEMPEVEILTTRYEEIRPKSDFANFITARAVGGFPEILRWSRTALSRRGHLLLWVGGEDITKITNSEGWIWNPPAHVPESQRRFILIGRYIGESQ
jgi:16S rRNA (guanine527-N7)-methyltransferase